MERSTDDRTRDREHTCLPSKVVAACLGIGLLATVALTGCSSAGQATSLNREASTSNTSGASVASSDTDTSGPSEAAKMICGTQTRASVATALALPALPKPHDDWSNRSYVCTYDLDAGPLVITVKELPDAASAVHYFEGLTRHFGSGERIEGLANLGLPAYRTPDGTVIFAKDNMTLEVDATALRSALGPNRLSQTDFAYQVATNILACWKAHH